MLTIVLSGAKASEAPLRTAFAARGFHVHPDPDDHGLPEHPQGKKPRQAIAFVTVEHDDLDAVTEVAGTVGYVLRMHFQTPEPPKPSAEHQLLERLAALEAQVAALRGGE